MRVGGAGAGSLPARCRSTARHRYQAATERNGAQRAPIFGERARRRHAAQAIGEAKAIAHAEVVDRQHVGPAEAEHQQHFDGPAPDAAHLREPLDDFVVAERVQDFLGRHHAVDGLLRQVLDAGDLGERQPHGAHLFIRRREHQLGFEQRGPFPSTAYSPTNRPKMLSAAVPLSC